jgi:fumarate reductase subunit D
MPFLRKWLVHASWQMFAFGSMWLGFAFGYVLAQDYGILFKQAHTIIGTIVCCMMVLQPVFGWFHHRHYLKHKNRTHISYVHIFYGRALMILGVINGGLGLQLANASMSLIIAYSVVAVIMSFFYASGPLIKYYRSKMTEKSERSPISSPRPIYTPGDSPRTPYKPAGSTPSTQYSQAIYPGYRPSSAPSNDGYASQNQFYQNSNGFGSDYSPRMTPQSQSPPRRPPRSDLQGEVTPPQPYRSPGSATRTYQNAASSRGNLYV